MSREEAFFEKYKELAVRQQIKYGIPASVTLAQAAIEIWREGGQSGS